MNSWSLTCARSGDEEPWNPATAQLVAWPEDESMRQDLARRSIPRLLVIEETSPPPANWDDLEDWVRKPIDADEVRLRWAAIIDRWRERTGGLYLDDGLLRRGNQWAALSPAQVAVVGLVLARPGQVVAAHDLRTEFLRAGGTDSRVSFNSFIARLRRDIRPLGVILHRFSGARMVVEFERP